MESGKGIQMEHRIYKIGVISDTHGLIRNQVREVLRGCDVILHGGDFGGREVLVQLEQIAKVYGVRGNNDGEWAEDLPESRSFDLYGIHFYMVHDKKQIPSDLEGKDVIIYGHSHLYEETQKGNTLLLNPGGCGRRRFHYPVAMAVIEVNTEDGNIQVQRYEIETGGRRK